MSGADDSQFQMETHNDSHSGDESPVIVGTPTAQKRRKNRAKKQKTLEQKQTAMHSAIEAHSACIGEREASSSRSPSPPSSPNVNAAKKKGRTKTSPVWKHCH